MSDRNTNKIILTACGLFVGWMLIHFDALEGLNNLTNGAFYQTTAERNKEEESQIRQQEIDDDVAASAKDSDLMGRGLISIPEWKRRDERREDQLRQKRLAEGRKP